MTGLPMGHAWGDREERAELLAIQAERARATGGSVTTKQRLTRHQGEVLTSLGRMGGAGRGERYWVYGKDVGAPTGCEHLVRKGYAERSVDYGPRGGEHFSYRLTEAGLTEWNRRKYR